MARNSNEVIVRKAEIMDLEGIISMLLLLSPPRPGEEIAANTGESTLKSIIENQDYFLVVAKIGEQVVGTATLLVQQNLSHGNQPYAHLENVVTDTRFRGNGIGRKMVQLLLSEAAKRRCYKVILNCEIKNIPFYRCCGFYETGEIEMRLTP